MNSRSSRTGRAAAAAWLIASAFVWAGFLFGRSRDPWLWGYSPSYLLLILLLPVLLALPVLAGWLARRLGWRRLLAQLAPSLTILGLAYLLAAAVYYNRRQYLFDPYTQAPPQRIADIDAPRASGELRIAALGGSTTAGPMLAPDERYPAVLQEHLRAAGRRATVFNGGQNWWTTRHSLAHYVTHVRHWQPDVVIVMHAINDLYRSCTPRAYAVGEYDDLYGHFYGASIRGARPPSFPAFLFGQPLRLMDQQWYRPWRRREVDVPVSRFVAITPFERNLRTLVTVIRGDGAVPVLMTQPSLFTADPGARERAVMRFGEEFCLTAAGAFSSQYPSPGALRRAMDAYNAVVRQVASDLGARLADADPDVPRDLAHFIDDVHYTAAGARRVARTAFDVVEASSPALR